jgi:hypothetical protein
MKNIYPTQVVAYVDEAFPWPKAGGSLKDGTIPVDDQMWGPLFVTLVEMVERIPPELLPADQRRVSLMIATTQLKGLLDVKQGLRASLRTTTPGIGLGDPVTHIRAALIGLSDQVVSTGTTTLGFLNDPDLAESLRADISVASSALRNGEWKAATVLSGSVIEALLLWALQTAHASAIEAQGIGPKKKSLDQWELGDYIDAVDKFHCLEPNTIIEVKRAQAYRNLIHPGRLIRLGTQCDLGAAHIAVGALDHVIADLRAKKNHSH